jgi:hypothetical protein
MRGRTTDMRQAAWAGPFLIGLGLGILITLTIVGLNDAF